MAKKNFEQSLELLEKIVSELESGDLPLEESIKKFEEGMKLSKLCSQILDETEKKIVMLVKETDGNISEVPFQEIEP
ncbi:MAG: exodeoxyribonuclease VII small subunit [Proteobacteria bacterium]|nr:exodeoxyribonuclease VII small subunit [Pseudomonadota bacterium]